MTLIAVDFDKTLTEDSGDPYQVGGEKPDREMVSFVQGLKEKKHYDIIIWTARPWEQAGHIASLMTAWGVPYNGIKCAKGGADVYLDDKTVNHHCENWESRFDALAEYDNQDPDQQILDEFEKPEKE